jgi:hypothetical protein
MLSIFNFFAQTFGQKLPKRTLKIRVGFNEPVFAVYNLRKNLNKWVEISI